MFTAAITFKVVGTKKFVYSQAAGLNQDIGTMIEKFFKPNGLLVKTMSGFETQEEAQEESRRMFARAEAKHGRVPADPSFMDNPLFLEAVARSGMN